MFKFKELPQPIQDQLTRFKDRIVTYKNERSEDEGERIYFDPVEDKIIGRSTSGNYSFNFKKNLTFSYINSDFSNEELENKNLFIEVEKKKYPIFIQSEALKRTDFKNL